MKLKKEIIPGIIAHSEKELEEAIEKIGKNAGTIQLDIMDGKFVKQTSLWFNYTLPGNHYYEAHLMIKNPNQWIKENYGKVDTIIFHAETVKNPLYTIKLIQSLNKKAGIAINPKTNIKKISRYLPFVDQVVIMTVKPGKYGSTFIPKMLDKVRTLRKEYPQLNIEVDGGINPITLRRAIAAGANKYISGSYLMKSKDLKVRMLKLKNIIKR